MSEELNQEILSIKKFAFWKFASNLGRNGLLISLGRCSIPSTGPISRGFTQSRRSHLTTKAARRELDLHTKERWISQQQEAYQWNQYYLMMSPRNSIYLMKRVSWKISEKHSNTTAWQETRFWESQFEVWSHFWCYGYLLQDQLQGLKTVGILCEEEIEYGRRSSAFAQRVDFDFNSYESKTLRENEDQHQVQ